MKSVACSACKRPADSDVSIALSPLRKEERKTEQNQRTPWRIGGPFLAGYYDIAVNLTSDLWILTLSFYCICARFYLNHHMNS